MSAKKSSRQQNRRAPQPPTRHEKSFWTRTRLGVVVAGLAVLLVAVFVTFSRPAKKKLPDNPVLSTELPAIDGQSKFRLADYEGKVLVLNFWATWCGPCKNEIPHLIQIGREYRDRGVEVVGLSTEEPKTSREKVETFAREFGIDYKLGFSDRQFANLLMQGHTNIPQVFVMRDGRIFTRFRGFNPETGPAKLRAAIEQALQNK